MKENLLQRITLDPDKCGGCPFRHMRIRVTDVLEDYPYLEAEDITAVLAKELCDSIGILPGDNVEIFEHLGEITVIKKAFGSSKGSLDYLKPILDMTDEDSTLDTIHSRY